MTKPYRIRDGLSGFGVQVVGKRGRLLHQRMWLTYRQAARLINDLEEETKDMNKRQRRNFTRSLETAPREI